MTSDTDQLLKLLNDQQGMLDRLAALAQSQSQLIAEGRVDRLLDLLKERQLVIDQFTESQSQLTEITRGLDDRLSGVSGEHRDRIKRLINGIGERLSQVMQQDAEDQLRLKRGKEQIKQELTSAGMARQARNAYFQPSTNARFADDHG